MAARRYPKRGQPWQYMLDHMHDGCPKWPFARNSRGYGHIQCDGKVKDLHRVVCEIVHGPAPTPDHDAAHKCGLGHEGCFGADCIVWKTKTDNQADRVEHGTHDRGDRMWASKLTEDSVRQIRNMQGKKTQREIAEEFGISRPHVSMIQSHHAWSWLE
ncbi:hypothetical protein ASD85_06595 [Rhizobium sp. Root651]|nr:hypothetical protein ASD85_06595 [Rhizobium sp. Root651]